VNYERTVVSYQSEGNKIFAMLTIPWGPRPETGWPIIIFNHGYIRPDQYRTTERYVAYVDGFARNGYIVFRSDYRGHGDSEGEASGGYGTPAYTIDVLNGLAAVKTHPDADPDRIGMWGHSMGGYITLRSMVVSDEIDAGVIWGGVVVSYEDLFNRWRRPSGNGPTPTPDPTRSYRRRWSNSLTESYGTFEENPAFWDSISANSYVADLSGPLQLHHSSTDETVPVEFSEILYEEVQSAGLPVELYIYDGDDHDITANFGVAINRSINFFDTHVKNG
jgi:dipeptidyl aminopeptidase/acylaminoacyl peptidase